jgi:tetratricopeptide (TPR) repeat protein
LLQTLAEIAEVQYAQGKPDEAVASYKEAIQLQREIGNKTYLSNSLLNLGGIYSDRGQYDNALTNLKESLQMQRDRHDENYEAMCLSNIGTVYFLTGRCDDALTYHQQSLLLLQSAVRACALPVANPSIALVAAARTTQGTKLPAERRTSKACAWFMVLLSPAAVGGTNDNLGVIRSNKDALTPKLCTDSWFTQI